MTVGFFVSFSSKGRLKVSLCLYLNLFLTFILQEKQQREIEQTRNDMMTVIQAIRSEKYADVEGSASPRNPKELLQELATMRAEYEAKIAKLQEEHQEALRDAKRSRTVPLVAVEGEDKVKYSVNQLWSIKKEINF